jgi:RNA 3'-terminal phosphate cyclase (ATP)
VGNDMIVIDGAAGEGGGQVLRTALALAVITATPVRIFDIRGRRQRPGLLRQHLTAVRAAATVSGGALRGAELHARELEFHPGAGGVLECEGMREHEFAVGSAGSATLVFQTVLWPLIVAPGRARVVFEGGTHNPMAPPFPFIERVFLPRLRALGLVIEAKLEHAGFYPAGGGRFVVELEGGRMPGPTELLSRGEIVRREATAIVANLSRRIAARELTVVERELVWSREACHVLELQGRGPGNALCLAVECEHATELVTGFGDKGVSAEQVATRACAELRAWLDADVPVGEHLADQLLIPLALAASRGGTSVFATLPPSLHTRTNAELIARFLPVAFSFETLDERRALVRVAPR